MPVVWLFSSGLGTGEREMIAELEFLFGLAMWTILLVAVIANVMELISWLMKGKDRG
jgi:hypothetical protein